MDLKFHTMTVPSSEPLTTYLKFGLNMVEVTPSLWPLKLRSRAGSDTLPLMMPPFSLLVVFGYCYRCDAGLLCLSSEPNEPTLIPCILAPFTSLLSLTSFLFII